MEKKRNNNGLEERDTLPQPSSSDLRGRQSVRATFRLTEKAIEAISILSVHLGIKQKSLFDHLLEDSASLDRIAKVLQSGKLAQQSRIQKTYVLSRKTLSCLDRTSKSFDTPRDVLVEYSIRRLLPLIAQERDKHKKRREILGELDEYLRQGKKVLQKSKELLGEDDPVHDKLESAMNALFSAYSHVESFVERGRIIEDF